MTDDIFIQLHLSPIGVDSQHLSPTHVLDWLSKLRWWEWLLLLKVALVFWVLNITIILPTIYMQVMLYTDEMTSRHVSSLLLESQHLVAWALAHSSAFLQASTPDGALTADR